MGTERALHECAGVHVRVQCAFPCDGDIIKVGVATNPGAFEPISITGVHCRVRRMSNYWGAFFLLKTSYRAND